jgi:hypothetical protein
LVSTNNKEFAMRKVTPEERQANLLAKEAHVHSADCEHGTVEEAVAVAEPVEAVVEAVVAEPVAEPVEEALTVAETPAEEAVVEGKPKKKSNPKY